MEAEYGRVDQQYDPSIKYAQLFYQDQQQQYALHHQMDSLKQQQMQENDVDELLLEKLRNVSVSSSANASRQPHYTFTNSFISTVRSSFAQQSQEQTQQHQSQQPQPQPQSHQHHLQQQQQHALINQTDVLPSSDPVRFQFSWDNYQNASSNEDSSAHPHQHTFSSDVCYHLSPEEKFYLQRARAASSMPSDLLMSYTHPYQQQNQHHQYLPDSNERYLI